MNWLAGLLDAYHLIPGLFDTYPLIAGPFDAFPKASSTKMIAGLFDAYSLLEIETYNPSSVIQFLLLYRMTLKTVCPMYYHLFPFDSHTCKIQIASCKYFIQLFETFSIRGKVEHI